jgi:hypothetical protein
MAIYLYKHPETGEIFEIMRKMSESDKPFFAPDGIKCEKIIGTFSGWKKNREIYEVDADYVKKTNPRYIRLQNGKKIRYDPTKHC